MYNSNKMLLINFFIAIISLTFGLSLKEYWLVSFFLLVTLVTIWFEVLVIHETLSDEKISKFRKWSIRLTIFSFIGMFYILTLFYNTVF